MDSVITYQDYHAFINLGGDLLGEVVELSGRK